MNTRQLCRALVKRYGVRGLWLAYRMRQALWAGRAGETTLVRLPEWHQPILLRNRTADPLSLWQIAVEGAADFPVHVAPEFIVDAGANIGLASLALASRFPLSRIVAVEFERENVAMLRRNLSGVPQVKIVEAAIWPRSGSYAAVARPQHSTTWGYVAKEAAEGTQGAVPTISMPDLMAHCGLPRIDLLKMDIEGSEFGLFSGEDNDWLNRVQMAVIELHERIHPGVEALVNEVMALHGLRPAGPWDEYSTFQRVPGAQAPG